MKNNVNVLRVNSARMRSDFDALAQFGSTGDGGVHRPSLSESHLAARKWFREQIDKAGFEFHVDGAGNHSAFLPPPQPSPVQNRGGSKTLLLGSHLDSVPHGGRFDGGLGVCAALEVLRVVKENNLALNMNLEAMDFTDEEGTLVGLLGSSAIGGHLKIEQLQKPRGGRDILLEGMKRAGLTDQGFLSAARSRESIGGYLEVHIEQGPRLIRANKNIGIVTHIVGIASYRLKFIGRADHAGTTSMHDRLDAAQGASTFTTNIREMVMQDFPRCVANVGKMEFASGAFNIVPSSVTVSLEFRGPTDDEMQILDTALIERAQAEAKRFGLELEIEFLGKHTPTPMSEIAQNAFIDACNDLGLSHIPLGSGAGHDAQSLAHLCPVGMIFVPSVGGFSHSPKEFTEWDDCVNGANVLLQAVLRIAG
jgi:N-carbamoyl-L-amino-acid hydrolase